MASGTLTLVFPQWQGSGNSKATYYGAKYIKDNLLNGSCYREVPVGPDEGRQEKGINGYGHILSHLEGACEILRQETPDKVFLIGGDCGTELAPVSYLNKLYGGDLAVVWFDAHGDLNSPATSVSHNFHGMPLRCLLGDGDEALVKNCFSLLTPEQVIMAGIRELDPPEQKFIEEKNIDCVTVDDIIADARKIARMVREKGYSNVYVHIDLDVLYPEKYPWVQCPCDNGIDMPELMAALTGLKKELNIAGISLLELRPGDDMDASYLREPVSFCRSI
ncbi:arginase family protein [Methanocella arvoryzae]|uniref:Arginase n=1 Tax=Methanocella arvoryzae (strain DSM 22066 / NBRC 105507 / MRE50) TaxID=351160 RepID=Q0W2L4_METAR|nr:arginase family protein [Methanocella arvoryzae]CAJ37379.1 putative arginase [Methanocella arvoryzae MRE50]